MENEQSNNEASSGTSALSAGLGAEPRRAVRLTLQLDADTIRDLAHALEQIAMRVERDEMTTGCSGGYTSGYSYELLQDPEQTHDGYFAQLREHLEKKAPNLEVRGPTNF